jgi:hypothetical protein
MQISKSRHTSKQYARAFIVIPWVSVTVEAVIHYHIDWTKVKFGIKDITKPMFWTQFGLDQLAHQITYILMAWFLLVA